MTNHDIERLDKAIERLAGRITWCTEELHRQRSDVQRLEDKAQRLETEIADLRRQMR